MDQNNKRNEDKRWHKILGPVIKRLILPMLF